MYFFLAGVMHSKELLKDYNLNLNRNKYFEDRNSSVHKLYFEFTYRQNKRHRLHLHVCNLFLIL